MLAPLAPHADRAPRGTRPRAPARLVAALRDRGGALALLLLAGYAALAPRTIVDGDNAEFSTLAVTGGLAHPPGFPAYVLWLRAWSWLPAASPAHGAALATCVLAAAAVLTLHAAARAWGARPAAAGLACAIYAVAPPVLRMHTEAEAFAGNALAVAAVLWLAAAGGPLRGAARVAALGAVAGLGLANHPTCALVAPVGLLGVARGAAEARARGGAAAAVRALIAGAAGLAVGLAPYAYLFLAPRGGASWGHVDDLAALARTVTRADYGGAAAFDPRGGAAAPGASLAALAATLGRGWLYAPAALGLAALAARAAAPSRRPEPTAPDGGDGGDDGDDGDDGPPGVEPRAGWLALALSLALAGPVLATRFNVPPVGVGRYVVERFHLLPLLLLAVPVAAGLDAALARLARLARRPLPRRGGWRATCLAGAIAAAGAAAALPHLAEVHSTAVEDGVRNMFVDLPEGAVIIGASDDRHAGALYLQEALGEPRRATWVSWKLAGLPWYRALLRARGVPEGVGDGPWAHRLTRGALAAGRPLYVDGSMRSVLAALPSYPEGLLIRVLPPGASVPPLDELVERNRARYARFALRARRPGPDADLATEAFQRYADTWLTLADALERAGRRGEAAEARALAADLGPTGPAASR